MPWSVRLNNAGFDTSVLKSRKSGRGSVQIGFSAVLSRIASPGRFVADMEHRSHFVERNELLLRFVPQRQSNAGKALGERDPSAGAQPGVIAQDAGQPVKRNAAAQMMDMMNAYIRREPL